MFVIGSNGSSGYNLTRSLRFRSSASAYLNRTPTNAGNRKTFTWSGWVKRGALGINGTLFSNGNGVNANGYFSFRFNTDNTVSIFNDNDGTLTTCDWSFTNVFRDVAAWYHLILAIDTTQATQTNRLKLYVNGVENTNRSVVTYPSQNSDLNINRTVPHQIGQFGFGSSQYFDGYLAEINFVDGSQLTPSSFGSYNSVSGVWQPERYTGTYGTNGFYLPFTDNSALTTSSNAGLGKDFSGNGNYWTTNNISITSGVTYDSMTDVCTLTSATAANFAVLNPLRPTGSGGFSNGNLTGTSETSLYRGLCSTIVLPYTGKWYAEVVFNSNIYNWCGVTANDVLAAEINSVGQQSVLYYALNGNKYVNGTGSAYGASYTTETIGIAFDGAAGTVTFYKANVSQGAITLPSSTAGYVFVQGNAGGVAIAANWNFGQRPFTYTPPTNFVALNTFNLPDSTIVKGNTVMDATLYTGNSSTQTVTNAGAFKPDFVWIKDRSVTSQHVLTDSVRGVNKQLFSSLTNAEQTSATGITSFNSNGFTTGANPSPTGATNSSPDAYVAWQWQAGQGTNTTNTNGTITSTVSVNASAGFSVVTYTGTNVSGATIGHGLGVAPRLIIIKNRSSVEAWPVYHSSVGATKYLVLNTTAAEATSSTPWNNTAPTSTVFSLGNWNALNESGSNHVAYCWTPIAGFSAFGSYTGNGGTDGPFIYTGFRPKCVMTKRTDAASSWYILDTSRSAYNAVTNSLYPDLSNAEVIETSMDILSNGFKFRNNFTNINASGGTYIYIAYAENPTKFALAR